MLKLGGNGVKMGVGHVASIAGCVHHDFVEVTDG
jgi:hypothetical protein